MKKCSPLGILLGDSVSVLLKAIQKSNRIAHHVRWRSWHGGQVLVGIHPLYARRRARPIGQLPGFDSCMRGGFFELSALEHSVSRAGVHERQGLLFRARSEDA